MSRSRTSFVSLLALLLAARPAPAAGAPGGGYVTVEHARAAEALIGVAFPGATRDWYDDNLVWPDGRRELLALSGLNWQKAPHGYWIAAGLEFPERLTRETRRLRATRAPAEAVRSRLVLVRADAEFRVLAHKLVELDPDSPLNSVGKLEILAPPAGRDWPDLDVSASSAGERAGAVVVVSWRGLLNGDTLAWTLRAPRSFLRQAPDGRVSEDLVEARLDERGRTTFRGVSSGEALPGVCEAECRMAPLALLEAPAR